MTNKDWGGNKRTTYAQLGASNHCDHERQNEDFYATDSIAIDKLKVSGNKENFLKICKLWLTNAFKGYIILLLIVKWHHSQVVRQRSAKPSSPVRIWVVPPFDTCFALAKCYMP